MNQPQQMTAEAALQFLSFATEPVNSVNLSRVDIVNCHNALIFLADVVTQKEALAKELAALKAKDGDGKPVVPSSPE